MRRALCYMGVVAAILAAGATTILPEEKDFVEFFKSSTEVQKALEFQKSKGYNSIQSPKAIIVGGSCGVAGCSWTVLVVEVVQTSGANPQTRNVAALVEGPVPSGKPDHATLIQLERRPKTP